MILPQDLAHIGRTCSIFPPLVPSLCQLREQPPSDVTAFAFSKLLLLLSRGVNSQFVILHERGSQEGGKRRGRQILKIDDENKAERT